ncbi:MAG: ATP-binding cassette domain-containing protein [Actinomycetota bacterium]|nr:ATP-binding cassette domain-containing protein [Actinomycetota bacterium]
MTTTLATGGRDQATQRRILIGVGIAVVLVAAYFGVDKVHPFGAGVLVKGLVVGGLDALVAMGLVLIYRSARIINFSQQVMGGLAAAVAVLLVEGKGWSYWVAVPLGLVAAVVTGWLVEALFIRRMSNAPRLLLTVATIGIYQLLGAAQLGFENLVPQKSAGTFSFPIHISFYLNPNSFTGDDIVAMAAVPVALILLYVFFVRTDYGVAIRGAADSSERALLLGIPVRNLSRVTWIVAALLSGVGAILAAQSNIGNFTVGQVTTPAALLLPLAAAVLGGMESLPLTVLWSLVLGVVNEVVYAITLQAAAQDVAQFIAIGLGLMLMILRNRITRVDDGGMGDFVAIREVAPIPHHLARLRQVVAAKWVVGVVVLAAAVAVPLTFSQSNQLVSASVAIYAIIGVSIVVLTGWAGQISLGQFAFVGVGAATAGALLIHQNVNFLVAMVAAAVVGAVVAVILGIPSLRVPGLYLAVATLAFAVPVSSYLLSSQFFPWLNPSQVGRPILFGRINLGSQATFYEFCLAILILVVAGVRNMRLARTGRGIIAVRDNARGAAAYGVSPMRSKLLAFVISGAIAGIAGSLYELSVEGIKAGGLQPDLSITVFVMVVIGGLGSISGAVLGAIVIEGVNLIPVQSLQLLATGVGVLFILLVIPEGLGSLVFMVRDWWLTRLELRLGRKAEASELHQPGEESARARELMLAGGINEKAHSAALRLGALEALEAGQEGPADGKAPDASPPDRQLSLVSLVDVDAGYTSRTKVLNQVAIGIGQTEVVALLGTNGAGKTTVLRTIAGLLTPTRGAVRFAGQDISSLTPAQRVQAGLVTVLGGRSVFPSLTVAENLRLATWTARHHMKDQAFIAAAMERVLTMFPILRARRDQRAGLLSGGEQQMLALAQALLCRPKLLLIDELSLGLSPSVVADLLEVVRALAASGVTVVIVEQSVNVATAISGRAIFMERGRVRFSGPTPDLSQQPKLLRSVFLSAAKRARRRAAQAAASGEGPQLVAAPPPPGTPGAPPPAFTVAGVSKHYGGVAALDDVSLSVAPGEILGIIGSNGAGKTTLFDVCSGFTVPDSGHVAMEGREITRLSPARRASQGLGRVFQDARLFPSLTVADTLATALEQSVPVRDPLAEALGLSAVVHSEEAIRDRVEELLVEMGLERYRDSFISELSTGTRRVVELACAVAHRPKVLLLDEPTSGIAQRESEALGELILGLREQTGAAFVVIEHDVPLVSSVADRLMCMHVGRFISEGSTSEVLNDPSVVAAYLGTDDAAVRRSGPVAPRPAPKVPATVGAPAPQPVAAGVGAAPMPAAPQQYAQPMPPQPGMQMAPPPPPPGYVNAPPAGWVDPNGAGGAQAGNGHPVGGA